MPDRLPFVVSDRTPEDLLRDTLAAVAPGTTLRDGLERILRGRTGALIVLGFDTTVEQVSTGGFILDVEFSATRLRELAKNGRRDRHRSGCLPDSAGRRATGPGRLDRDQRVRHPAPHGRASCQTDRVSGRFGQPVDAHHCPVRRRNAVRAGSSDAILAKANQALATLERYKARLDEVTSTLSALEIEDLVTVRDVSIVIQRLEMVRRISEEIAHYVVELGTDGRLLSLQLDELIGGVSPIATW